MPKFDAGDIIMYKDGSDIKVVLGIVKGMDLTIGYKFKLKFSGGTVNFISDIIDQNYELEPNYLKMKRLKGMLKDA